MILLNQSRIVNKLWEKCMRKEIGEDNLALFMQYLCECHLAYCHLVYFSSVGFCFKPYHSSFTYLLRDFHIKDIPKKNRIGKQNIIGPHQERERCEERRK